MNLESSAASMLEQFPEGSGYSLQRQERALERFGKVAFIGFGIAAVLGVIAICYIILTNMIFSGTQPLAGILFLAFVIFAALGLTYVIWNEILKEQRRKLNKTPDLTSSEPNIFLPPRDTNDLIPIPSVVEDTTKRLKIDAKNRAK